MSAAFDDLLQKIPDYKEFLTVDEMDANSRQLAEEYPDVVECMEIGRTRGDHPLYCLKIGSGSQNALLFGCPHPNEPIGAMMLEYFSRALASDAALRQQFDYTWYIVKSWDADGTKLNENWFKGPFTLYNYARNFFRPAGHQQVDWTFPIDHKNLHFHKPIPETKAMMALIDEIQPQFIYSLHNAGFGGVYWYISEEVKPIYEAMSAAAARQGIPLSLGEPEAPYCITLAPAVYKMLGIQQHYDYLEQYGIAEPEKDIKCGTSSADYAYDRYGSFTLVTELPYFFDPRIADLSAGDISRRDAMEENIAFAEETDAFVRDTLAVSKSFMAADNPFKLALEAFTDGKNTYEATRKMIVENPDFSKTATKAEIFDNLLVSKFYKLLMFGLLLRANEIELLKLPENAESEGRQSLETARAKAEERLNELSAELEDKINYEVIPIKKLVAIQLESGLLIADYLQKNGAQQ